MRANHKDSRANRNTLKRLLIKSLVKADELSYESHVRVDYWSSLLHVIKSVLVVHFLAVD